MKDNTLSQPLQTTRAFRPRVYTVAPSPLVIPRFVVFVLALLVGSLAFAAEQKSSAKTQSVVVDFVVGPDGRPTQIKIIEAADKKLADAVLAAVTKWQFDKKFVGKKVRQPVEFQLDDDASKQKKATHSPEPTSGTVR